MPRNDRLYELTRLLRQEGVHRAADLAGTLGVSVRTIWRDMERLIASGLPIEGTRGRGYRITAGVTLPALNLSLAEMEALSLGLAVVAEAADPELQAAARSLSGRLGAELPETGARPPGLDAFPFAEAARGFRHMPRIRQAIAERRKLSLTYPEGPAGAQVVRPLHMEFWARLWTLTAWSETAGDFAVFRVERIGRLELAKEGFEDEPGRTLDDFLTRYEEGPYGN